MLEEHDKQKFIMWLERQISDLDALARPLKSLGVAGMPVLQMHERERQAFTIVKDRLKNTQTISISRG